MKFILYRRQHDISHFKSNQIQKNNTHLLVCVFCGYYAISLSLVRAGTAQIWLHFSSLREEKLMFTSVEPSATTVHRAVEFNGSNLSVPVSPKTKSTPDGVLFTFVISVHFRYHFSVTKKNAMLPNFYLFRSQDSTFVIIALWRHALPE